MTLPLLTLSRGSRVRCLTTGRLGVVHAVCSRDSDNSARDEVCVKWDGGGDSLMGEQIVMAGDVAVVHESERAGARLKGEGR